MTVEALLGTDRAFAADLLALRPQPGQAASARNLRRLLAGSPIVASHRIGDPRVQDAYSLRCAPQVHGAARDSLVARDDGRRARARVGDRQPDGPARRPGRVLRQLPRGARRRSSATCSRSSAAQVGAIAERRTDRLLDAPARTACRRSSPTMPASTPA